MATFNLPNEGDFPWDLNPAITAINSEVEATTNLVTTGRLSDANVSATASGAAAPLILASTKLKSQYGLRIVTLGDSYMATTIAQTGAPGSAGSTTSYPARHPLTWANYRLGGRLNLVGAFGVSGEQTHQWLARYESQVPATKPDIVFMGSAGINDMNNGKTPAQVMANLRVMFDRNAEIGALTVMFGPVPFGDSTTDQRSFIHTMAALLRIEAQSRRNFILLDCHPALSTLTDADTWLGLPAAKYTSDGIHLGMWGAMRVGKMLADALAPVVPPMSVWPSGTASKYSTVGKNMLANAGLTGTTGTLANGATGVVADSWTINSQSGATFAGTVVASKVASTDFGGDWQQITISGSASNAQFFQNVTTGYTVGKTYIGVMEVDTSDYQPTGGSGACRLKLQHNITGGNSFAQGVDVTGVDESLGFAPDLPMGRGIALTPPLILGEGASRQQLGFLLRGTGTIRFRRPAIMQVD